MGLKKKQENKQLVIIQEQIDAYLESLEFIDGDDEKAKEVIRIVKTLEDIKKEYVRKKFFDKQTVLELAKIGTSLLQFMVMINDEGFRSFTSQASKFMVNVVPKMKNV